MQYRLSIESGIDKKSSVVVVNTKLRVLVKG
jgi:hypothetical protein